MSEAAIPLAVPCLGGNAETYIRECLDTNFVSSVGPFVQRFEQAFAEAVGAPLAVACNSGTAALHVALRLAGVQAGDEVLVSDFSFIATVNPIAYLGARPVLVDADEATWNLDPALVIAELERRDREGLAQPRAVVAAHVLGLPADLAPVQQACERFGVALVEDAAEALGARYVDGPLAGRQVGTVGLLGCYSFNGNKVITTGGGGMIVTADAALADRARHLIRQARLPGPEYLHDAIGYNYGLPNLAAALGVAQLERLPGFLERKRAIAARYDAALAGLPGITLAPRRPDLEPSCWLYSVLLDPAAAGTDRRAMLAHLAAHDVQSRPVWAPAHRMPFYRDAARLGGAVGDRLFEQGLSLPCSVSLGEAEQDRVLALVRSGRSTSGA